MAGISITWTPDASSYNIQTDTPGGGTVDDYALWNGGSGSGTTLAPSQRKSGGGSVFSSLSRTVSGNVVGFSGALATASWTGGTPTASGSNNNACYNDTNGSGGTATGFGLSETVSGIGTTTQNIRVRAASFNGNVQLTVSLSDSSAGPTSNTSLSDTAGTTGVAGYYDIAISAGSAGQSATLVWTVSGGRAFSDIELQGMTIKAASTGVTCNLSVTDAADTLAATATVAISAALARTDTADALSASATVAVVANLSATDAADTLTSTAGVRVTANASATDTADSLSASAVVGNPPVTCDLAVIDAADTLAAAAQVVVGATLAATDAGDALVAAAGVLITAALSATDQADALEAIALTQPLAEVVCSLAVTDEADALQATFQSEERRGHGGRNAGFRYYDDFFAPPMQARLAVQDEDDKVVARARSSWVQRVVSARLVDGDDTLRAGVVVEPWAPLVLMRTAPELQREGVWRPTPGIGRWQPATAQGRRARQ